MLNPKNPEPAYRRIDSLEKKYDDIAKACLDYGQRVQDSVFRVQGGSRTIRPTQAPLSTGN